jgi:hypothetical protein
MSLKEFLDANSIANEIRLERQVRKVAVLVVEGSDDRKLFAKLVHLHRCSIVGAYGKDNVLKVVSILDGSGFQGMLGIADKDFDEIENIEHTSANLIFTDEHDLECMMIRSEALFRLLIENATEHKLQEFEAREGAVQDALLNRAQVIGCARLISRRHNLNLDFDEMKFRFINDENLRLDVDRLVNQIVSRTTQCTVTRSALRQLIESEMAENHDAWQISSGHDIVSILAIAIRRCIGSATSAEADPTLIASKLRLAYSVEDFHSTSMFFAICSWEARHPQFAFIRGPCPEFIR